MQRKGLWSWLKKQYKRKIFWVGVIGVMGVMGVAWGKIKREGQVVLPVPEGIISWEEDLKLRLFEPVEVKYMGEENLQVKLREGVVVNFSLRKEREEQFDSLQVILDRHRIEGKPVKRIDLRFDKPVVVYE